MYICHWNTHLFRLEKSMLNRSLQFVFILLLLAMMLTMTCCERQSKVWDKMDLAESFMISDILRQNGDFAGVLEAYQNFSTIIDSIHQDIFSHDLLFVQKNHEKEKTNFITLQKRTQLIWLTLCVAFVLLIIVGYTYYHYRLSKTTNLLEKQENIRLQLEQEKLKKENENLELRNHQTELERKNLQQANEKLELERHNAVLEKQTAELECERQSLIAKNLLLKVGQLEDECAYLKDILEKRKDLAKPIGEAIKIRIEMLNILFVAQITDNEAYAKSYGVWSDRLLQDKDEFMNTTRLAFKVSHPKFMEFKFRKFNLLISDCKI